MDWRAPFHSLCEIFPQVDKRIIKAVALEHANDVDSAVEFILNEVISNQNEQKVTQEPDSNEGRVDGCVTKWHYPFVTEQMTPTTSQISRSHSLTRDDMSEVFDDVILTDRRSSFAHLFEDLNATRCNGEFACSPLLADSLNDQEMNNVMQENCPPAPTTLLLPKQFCDEAFMGASSSLCPLNPGQSKNGAEKTEFSINLDGVVGVKEECITGEDKHDCLHSGKIISTEFEGSNVDNPSSNYHLSAGSVEGLLGISSRVSCTDDSDSSISRLPYTDIVNVGSFEGKNQNIEGTKRSFSSLNSSVLEGAGVSLDAGDSSGKESVDSLPGPTQESPQLCEFNEDNTFDVEVHNDSSIHSIEDSSLSCSRASSSSQVLNTDGLEGFVSQAKKNKETLMEAMESIRFLRIKADHEEVAARRAKDEAAKAGLDILYKVEELRQLLVRAKEANDMHAGEIYGERAILATEARELQSRLEQLAVEKEKAFRLIDEMRESLEARIDAAKREREVAEEEKMRKEESAQKVLAMEEALMAKVAQDSRELELEAEASTKLREFLIDRGHIVDALQGEVAVLCEDVKLLKEQMDGGVTTVGNGFLSIKLPSASRHQNMNGHGRSQSLTGSYNHDASIMGEHQAAAEDMNFGSVSSKSYVRNDDITMSQFSMTSGTQGSPDVQSVHSGALYESIESLNTVLPVSSAGILTNSIPDTEYLSSTHYSDVERDYHKGRLEAFMAETDMECQNASLKSSTYSRAAVEKQPCLKVESDDDGWQMLDDCCEGLRKSGPGSASSLSSVKTKQS